MKKFKPFFSSIASRESWLNSIQHQGYRLTKVSSWLPLYTFEKWSGPLLTVRLDCRESMKWADFRSYLTLFEDSGWRHIAGSSGGGIQYFQQAEPGSDDAIFSDQESRAVMIGRFRRYSLESALSALVIAYIGYTVKVWDLLQPDKWNLSQLTDWLLLPLAVIGAISPILLAIASLYYGLQALSLSKAERKALRKADRV